MYKIKDLLKALSLAFRKQSVVCRKYSITSFLWYLIFESFWWFPISVLVGYFVGKGIVHILWCQ